MGKKLPCLVLKKHVRGNALCPGSETVVTGLAAERRVIATLCPRCGNAVATKTEGA